MGYSTARAKLESELARAHRALYYAEAAAEDLNEPGTAEDLKQLQREVVRIAEGSLRGRPNTRSVLPGQLNLT